MTGTNSDAHRSQRRELLALAVPAALSIASDPVLTIADTAMIGQLGAIPLAAKAIASALIGGISWIFAFLIFGTTTLVAGQYGAGQRQLCGEIYHHALFIAVASGVGVGLLCLIFAPQLYGIMGADAAVSALGVPYLRLRSTAVPLTFFIYACVGFLRGIQNTKTPMRVAFLVAGLNLVLDYNLIYGNWLFPPLGLWGAGFALLAAQIAGAVIYARLLFSAPYAEAFALRRWGFSSRRFRSLSSIGRDLAIRTGALRLSLLIATAAVARMGPVYLAGYEIAFQLFIFCSDTIDGLAVAGQALAAKALGAAQRQRAVRLARLLVVFGCSAGLCFGAIYVTFHGPLLRLLTGDPTVREIFTTQAFPLLVVLQPFNGIVFALDGFLLGAHDTRFLMRAMLLGALVIFIPISYASLHWHWELFGVWSGFSCFMLYRLATNLFRVASKRWVLAFALPRGVL